MNTRHLSLFIPDSLTAETKDLKLKTYKVGLIARSAAIFRAKRVVIYKDDADPDEANFIRDILTYMDTPQYLRKKVFPIRKELKHVGILPPLRTPHHPTGTPGEGDFRQGLTLKRTKKGTFVDIGAEKPAFCKEQLTVNKVLSFKITKLGKEIIVDPDQPDDTYWGYETLSTNKNLHQSLKLVKPEVVVATSRYGNPITSILDEVKSKVKKANHWAILFGGPYSGLPDYVSSQNLADFEVNMVPSQGTQTIRTEEAVLSTLSIFNLLLNLE
ncbi:RNA-binding protein [Methanobacterium alkalithermotolerans]|uniref:RNA-binding protein n=1 Tax=Methanobacterium alkalithermotolerans TaxID=2731220 RepID=A0A8T8K7T6_9EURY|nr:putative RNA uridine N3 methyltransferase [Methanobacterium alkalithermotolerans]QUH23902.1 RNA-binding protein [Methanobacterium alkalithermotolerans]RJS49109.1 MAG: RNA-binding protein [Methanobacterium sp.]